VGWSCTCPLAGTNSSTCTCGQSPQFVDHNVHSQAIFNFVCEIPRGQTAKLEIDTDSAYNPIVQDVTKKGACLACLGTKRQLPARPLPLAM